MTIVSFNKNFILIRPRKSAGLSVQRNLDEFCTEKDIISRSTLEKFNTTEYNNYKFKIGNGKIHEHNTLLELEKLLNLDLSKFFSFGFVRNPWDLMVSRYFWNKYTTEHKIRDPDVNLEFSTWLKKRFSRELDEKTLPYLDYRRDLQYRYFYNFEEKLIATEIGKYESLQSDFDRICKKIEIKSCKLPHLHKINLEQKNYATYYNNETKNLVRRYFEKDIQLFEYSFNN